jgi:hypothetical protein
LTERSDTVPVAVGSPGSDGLSWALLEGSNEVLDHVLLTQVAQVGSSSVLAMDRVDLATGAIEASGSRPLGDTPVEGVAAVNALLERVLPLPEDQLDPGIRRSRDLKRCVQLGASASDQLDGRVVLGLTIGAEGRVGNSRVEEDTIESPEFLQCILGASSEWAFPGYQPGAVLQWPFEISP